MGRALGTDRHVGVTAQVTLLHIRLRDAQPAQQLAQAGEILSGFVRRAQVGAGDHFDQRHAAAIEIDQAHPALVDRLPASSSMCSFQIPTWRT